jgi:oligoendopeptidase F
MACIRCWLADQGALMASTPLTLAETARVRRDADLPRACSSAPPTGSERKALLAGKVEDMINTVVRQIAFYEFERKCPHRAAGRAS